MLAIHTNRLMLCTQHHTHTASSDVVVWVHIMNSIRLNFRCMGAMYTVIVCILSLLFNVQRLFGVERINSNHIQMPSFHPLTSSFRWIVARATEYGRPFFPFETNHVYIISLWPNIVMISIHFSVCVFVRA